MGKADGLSSIPEKHTVEKEDLSPQFVLCPHVNAIARAYLHACTQNKLKCNKISF